MMKAPDGYKPVIHKTCGGLHSWVKKGVCAGMKMHAEDVMLLDGTVPGPQTAIAECPNCGLMPTGNSLTIKRESS